MPRLAALLALCLFAPLLLLPTAARAYIPPAEFLLRMMLDKQRVASVQDLTVYLTATIKDQPQQVEERLYLKRPERTRFVQQTEKSLLYIERDNQAGSGVAGEPLQRHPGGPRDLLARLFVPQGKTLDELEQRLLAHLKTARIDTQVVSLGRYSATTAAFIIGALPWETDKPQLWLDKETFLPVRYVLVQAGVALPGTSIAPVPQRHEVRLLQYNTGATAGQWFPSLIEEYRGEELVRRAEVTRLQANAGLPESLFELGAASPAAASPAAAAPPSPPATPNGAWPLPRAPLSPTGGGAKRP